MDFEDVIRSRRSVRKYQSDPIPDELLRELLETACTAPSAVNYQPWYFVAVRSPEAMERLCAVMGRVTDTIEPGLKERFAKHPEVVSETTRFMRQLGGAPVCVLAFELKDTYEKTAGTIVQSVAAAIENLVLAATNRGLGSCWLTAPVEAGVQNELRDMFAPEKGELVAVVTLGYPDQAPKAPPRKDGRYILI